jgi:hypothetical protein
MKVESLDVILGKNKNMIFHQIIISCFGDTDFLPNTLFLIIVLIFDSTQNTSHHQILRIAQISALSETVPPKNYGSIERIAHYITEELVRRGHQVNLNRDK